MTRTATPTTANEGLPAGVRPRLRVATDVGVGVHALRIALFGVRREKHRRDGIIIPGVIKIQPSEGVVELTGVALVGADAALGVALVAIRAVGLLALDGTAGQVEQDAALGVGEIIAGGGSVAGTDQVARQAIIIELAGEDTGTGGGQFLQATIGVGNQAGRAATGRAFEHPIARGIIHLLLLPGRADGVLDQVVEGIIRERLGDP